MTVLHAQTLINEARRAREDRGTRYTQSSTRDLFCAQLVGYLSIYDRHLADELALALEMPELASRGLRKLSEENKHDAILVAGDDVSRRHGAPRDEQGL